MFFIKFKAILTPIWSHVVLIDSNDEANSLESYGTYIREVYFFGFRILRWGIFNR